MRRLFDCQWNGAMILIQWDSLTPSFSWRRHPNQQHGWPSTLHPNHAIYHSTNIGAEFLLTILKDPRQFRPTSSNLGRQCPWDKRINPPSTRKVPRMEASPPPDNNIGQDHEQNWSEELVQKMLFITIIHRHQHPNKNILPAFSTNNMDGPPLCIPTLLGSFFLIRM